MENPSDSTTFQPCWAEEVPPICNVADTDGESAGRQPAAKARGTIRLRERHENRRIGTS